jgi:hypothetical protein
VAVKGLSIRPNPISDRVLFEGAYLEFDFFKNVAPGGIDVVYDLTLKIGPRS